MLVYHKLIFVVKLNGDQWLFYITIRIIRNISYIPTYIFLKI